MVWKVPTKPQCFIVKDFVVIAANNRGKAWDKFSQFFKLINVNNEQMTSLKTFTQIWQRFWVNLSLIQRFAWYDMCMEFIISYCSLISS